MQGPVSADLVGEWESVSFVSADQIFSNPLPMFGTTMEYCMIPASCESLPDSCFAGSRIVRVTFASGSVLKRIGKEAFRGCGQLREIEIPASVEEIGEACFSGCSSLSRVTFACGSAVRRIGKAAFRECKNLREMENPADVESLGDYCFRECAGLQTINIPDSVESLGDYCFDGCTGLRSVSYSAGTKIGYNCFRSCPRNLQIRVR